MQCYTWSICGRRKVNEDRHLVFLNLNKKKKNINAVDLLAVFDGHGGKGVSDFLYKKIKELFIINEIDYNIITIDKLYEYMDKIADELKRTHIIFSKKSGSTMCMGIRVTNNHIWILNCGDSRAVICNSNDKAIPLTIDHKPCNKNEYDRIVKLGGQPIKEKNDDCRIKSLSVSRSFGDLDTSPYIIHTPDITLYNISKHKFIIFACDGLWDVFENQEAVDFVLKLMKINNDICINYSEELVKKAYSKKSYDNITVIVYFI